MWTLALTFALLSPPPVETQTVAHWPLAGTLASAVGGEALRVSPPEAGTFAVGQHPGGEREVLRLAAGSQVVVPLSFLMVSPGYLGRWSIVFDVRVTPPDRVGRRGAPIPGVWTEVPLVQTDGLNLDGAELSLSAKRGLEVAGAAGGRIDPERWQRVGMVVDEVEGTVTGYLDGVMVKRVKTTVTDSRWSVERELLLFADKDGTHPGLEVANLQVRLGTASGALVEGLRGPESPVPWPERTALAWRGPVPAALTSGSPFAVGFVASPASGEVVLAYQPEAGEAVVLARAAADSGRVLAVLPPAAADIGASGHLELTWEGKERERLRAPVAVRSQSDRPRLSEELLVNGDLEVRQGAGGVEVPGWRVTGAITARTIGGAATAISGEHGDFVLAQVVPMPAGLATGGYAVTLRARLRRAERASAFGDRGVVSVKLRDRAGRVAAHYETLGVDGERWHERVALGPIPEGTVEAEIAVTASERQGDGNSVSVDAVSLVARPIGSALPRLSKLPVVIARDLEQLSIVFETDASDVAPRVEVVSGEGLELAPVVSTTIDERHVVHLATLPKVGAGRPIEYRVVVGEHTSPTWIVAAPRTSGPLRVGFIADNQHGWTTFRTLVPQLTGERLDLLFVAGDIVQHGHKLREWQTEWFSPLSIGGFAQRTPLLVARGNHDANGAFAHAYVPLPGNGHWYAQTRNGVRFIALDTEADAARAPSQLRWLEDELKSEASRRARFRVVSFHRAPFSNRWDRKTSKYNGESWVRQHLVPLFSRHGVDLVVAGHAHAYQRLDLDGVRYVVVGGAGGALDRHKTGKWPMDVDWVGHHFAVLDVSDETLGWVARDFEGKEIDRFELHRRAAKASR